MKYIDQWLSGLGLEYIIPKLKENGITTPKKLAQLTLRDMYEVVGVQDAEDRKKLYYLIQRLQLIINKDQTKTSEPQTENDGGEPDDRAEEFAEESKIQSNTASVSSTRRTSVTRINSFGATPRVRSQQLESGREQSPLRSNRQVTRQDKMDVAPAPSVTSDENGEDELRLLKRRAKNIQNYQLKDLSNGDSSTQQQQQGAVGQDQKPGVSSSGIPTPHTRRNAQQGRGESNLPPQTQMPPPTVASDRNRRTSTSSSHTAGSSSAAPTSTKSTSSGVSGAASGTSGTNTENKRLSIGGTSSKSQKEREEARRRAQSPGPPKQQQQRAISPVKNIHQQHQQRAISPANREIRGTDRAASPGPNSARNRELYDREYDNFREQQGRAKGRIRDRSDDAVEDMAIRVVVRKRPVSRAELARGDRDVMDVLDMGEILVHEPKTKVDLTKVVETQSFIFDDAFDADETNEVIYRRTMKHLVGSVFEGGKASVFAYGQTGSGKTFTMMGSKPAAPAEAKINAGLYVLAARDIFSILRRPSNAGLEVYMSCFEIYGGKLFDLLAGRAPVKCLEDSKQQVQLPGLSEHRVSGVEDLLDMMAQAHTLRSTGSTGANEESSRSHMVLQIVVKQPPPPQPKTKRVSVRQQAPAPATLMGKLSFIDLAGSERGADTRHNSKQTRMEGAEINTSLLALKEVIRSLEKKHGHTPFRGSKLTQVLKDSFIGENTRTCMVACVSPSHSNCEHTLNTLRYADRVKEHHTNLRRPVTPTRGLVSVDEARVVSRSMDGGFNKYDEDEEEDVPPERPMTSGHQPKQDEYRSAVGPGGRPLYDRDEADDDDLDLDELPDNNFFRPHPTSRDTGLTSSTRDSEMEYGFGRERALSSSSQSATTTRSRSVMASALPAAAGAASGNSTSNSNSNPSRVVTRSNSTRQPHLSSVTPADAPNTVESRRVTGSGNKGQVVNEAGVSSGGTSGVGNVVVGRGRDSLLPSREKDVETDRENTRPKSMVVDYSRSKSIQGIQALVGNSKGNIGPAPTPITTPTNSRREIRLQEAEDELQEEIRLKEMRREQLEMEREKQVKLSSQVDRDVHPQQHHHHQQQQQHRLHQHTHVQKERAFDRGDDVGAGGDGGGEDDDEELRRWEAERAEVDRKYQERREKRRVEAEKREKDLERERGGDVLSLIPPSPLRYLLSPKPQGMTYFQEPRRTSDGSSATSANNSPRLSPKKESSQHQSQQHHHHQHRSVRPASLLSRLDHGEEDDDDAVDLMRPFGGETADHRQPSIQPLLTAETAFASALSTNRGLERSSGSGISVEFVERTSGLMNAHKQAIAEMVEVMKDEMALVQSMEIPEERDSEQYAERLAQMLAVKVDAVEALQSELNRFRSYRARNMTH